ncbi:MAG: tryptophan-rich sensory protein [Patescibacteria group bacterium]|nr:tryptophan-rich sensory protein [Patescibacteria group bacterium]
MNKKNYLYLKILAALGFVGVVAVNYLANALPIGGVTTGEASDAFVNLFTPAGVTFSIWGLIYLLLAVYVVYQFGAFSKKINDELIAKVNVYFILSSIANVSWIFAWHYGVIWLSVLLMLVLLVSLIRIADILRKESFTNIEKFCVRLPFSIYFGWITVATIANITVFLVSLNWNGFGLSDQVWAVIILLVGAGIGIWRMMKDRNIAYGLVIVWAYLGILLKHVSEDGWAGQYTSVIVIVIICIAALLAGNLTLVLRGKEKK